MFQMLSHIVAFVICVAMPAASYFDIKRLKRAGSDQQKERMYWIICGWYWVITAAAVYNSSIAPLFFHAHLLEFGWFVGIILSVVLAYLLLGNALPLILLPFNAELREKLDNEFSGRDFIYPRTARQRMMFVVVAVTVGITEELLFRGFLYNYFVESWSLSTASAFLLSASLFGIVHFNQGIRGIFNSMLFGFAMGFLYISTGSLMLPIILHILYDLKIVFMSRILDNPKGGMVGARRNHRGG